METLFSGTVHQGQFVPDDPVRYAGRMARLEGRRVRATVRKETLGRTLSQNKYYWGVVLATLAEWSGHEPEELHDFLKTQWLGLRSRSLPSGHGFSVHPSTRTLSVEEFSEYVDKVVRWAAEQGVRVPDASEVLDA